MESVEVTARTVSDAVAQALTQLGKTEDEVAVTVLSRGGPPQILAFGSAPARVRVAVKPVLSPPGAGPAEAAVLAAEAPDAAEAADVQGTRDAEFARVMLAELLRRMDLNLDIEIRSIDPVTLNVVGPDVAELIGRRGSTLRALQFVLSIMVNKQLQRSLRLIVDADGYRQRRERLLQGMAERFAQRVRVTRQPMALEAMPPNERRIVHLALVDDPDVTTESEGEGDARRVVIKLRSP